ncbi:hypothetical protein [Daejeonella sp. H1SJ63]|uniref:hypothetical protein n=1 Tax=Daejeonella sp. H1SJ63 TaxID=3034145 RepID=UPI0023EC4762|nr:hypothetical protein [Daejeonella sp. H1SJ63]
MENLKFNDSQDESDQLHRKLDELILLISETPMDNETLQGLQKKFNSAIRNASGITVPEPYQEEGKRRAQTEGPEEDLDQLLFINTDKVAQRKHAVSGYIGLGLRVLIALLLILLGFGMIIMPAPPYFEMFTLFYLNPNDGVTIMDVISLIIAFVGVYILFSTFTGRRSGRV